MKDIYKDLKLLEDEQEEQDKDIILDELHSLTHLYKDSEEEGIIETPWYCLLESIASDFGYTQQEMMNFAKDNGYIVFKISPIGSFEGGLAIADKDVDLEMVKANIKKQVEDDFEEEKDIEVKISLQESKLDDLHILKYKYCVEVRDRDDNLIERKFFMSRPQVDKYVEDNYNDVLFDERIDSDELIELENGKDFIGTLVKVIIETKKNESKEEIVEETNEINKELKEECMQVPDEELERLEKQIEELGFEIAIREDNHKDCQHCYRMITKESHQTSDSFNEYIDRLEEVFENFRERAGYPCVFNIGLQDNGYICCNFEIREDGRIIESCEDRIPSKATKLSFRDGKPADDYTKAQLKDIGKHLNMSDDDVANIFPIDKKESLEEEKNINKRFIRVNEEIKKHSIIIDEPNGKDVFEILTNAKYDVRKDESKPILTYVVTKDNKEYDVDDYGYEDDKFFVDLKWKKDLEEDIESSEKKIISDFMTSLNDGFDESKKIGLHAHQLSKIYKNEENKDYSKEYILKVLSKHFNRELTGEETLGQVLNDKYHIDEDIEKHDTLNQKLFDDEELKPEVVEAIKNIANEFVKELGEDGISFTLKDIILLGSNMSYNYTKDSDLDIHLIADSSALECPKELQDKLYGAYRTIFNRNYDITIKGIPAEIYVELDEPRALSNGIYSLNSGWVKKPVQQDIPELDKEAFDELFKVWEDRYNELVNNKEATSQDVEEYINDIYAQRKDGIANEGEFSLKNLLFKEVRNKGYLDNLKELRKELKGKELSLEQLDKDSTKKYNRVEVEDMRENKRAKRPIKENKQSIKDWTTSNVKKYAKAMKILEELVNDEEAFWNIRNSISEIASDKYDEVNLILDNGKIRPITKDELKNKFAVSIEQVGDNNYKSKEELEKFARDTNALKVMFFVYKGQYGGEYSFLYDNEDIARKIAKDYHQKAYAKFDENGEYNEVLVEELKEEITHMTFEELKELADELNKFLEEQQVYYEVYFEDDDTISVDISWGDWKHDHLWFDHVAEKFFNEKGYDVVNVNVDVTDEDGSDTYSAIHSLQLRKHEDKPKEYKMVDSSSVKVEEESLNNLKNKKLREDGVVDTELQAMISSEDDQDEAYIGPFWYDPNKKEVYGQVLTLAKDKPFYKSSHDEKEVRTGTALHKAIWKKEEKRNKDKRFTGDYKQKPRGRVFEVKDDGFKVMVGNWINDYPEAKEEIIDVFQLPKNKTEFVIDKHWDIGHGWSEEIYLEGIRYCEDDNKDALKKERDELWSKMPDCTKDEIQRLIDIRKELGDDEFYTENITREALKEEVESKVRLENPKLVSWSEYYLNYVCDGDVDEYNELYADSMDDFGDEPCQAFFDVSDDKNNYLGTIRVYKFEGNGYWYEIGFKPNEKYVDKEKLDLEDLDVDEDGWMDDSNNSDNLLSEEDFREFLKPYLSKIESALEYSEDEFEDED